MLHSRPRSDGRRLYGCISGTNFHGCGKIRVVAEPVEELLAEAVLIRLDSPELQRMVLAEAAQDTQATAAEKNLADLGDRLETMAQAYARGEIGWGEYMAARKTISDLTEQAKES